MIRFLPVILGFLLLLLVPSSSLAHHKEAVLGEATASSELTFPPVTSGTGFILPDSPLFFVDKTFQQLKLLLAFSPEQKVNVRAQIAGERMAELRVMMARQSQWGINTVLTELTEETSLAAAALTEAQARGLDVGILAGELNEIIKTQRKILGIVEDQAGGALKLQLQAARIALLQAKVEVEDKLPAEAIEKETEENLAEELAFGEKYASESARKVTEAIARFESRQKAVAGASDTQEASEEE